MNPIELTTPDRWPYSFHFPNDSGFAQIQVKTAQDAHISLTNKFVKPNPIYEISLGAWSNQFLEIRKGCIAMPEVCRQKASNVLSDAEYRSFWIRWGSGSVSCGFEGQTEPAITYTDDLTCPNIDYIGIRSILKPSCNWIIQPPKRLEFFSDGKGEYKFIPNAFGPFKFRVQTPRDVQIVLARGPYLSHIQHEIIIGSMNNTKSVIRTRESDQHQAEADTPAILSCGEPRAFWISWTNGIISVGREDEGQFISYSDIGAVYTTHVGIRTDGSCGKWSVEQARQIELHTEGGPFTFLPNATGTFRFKLRSGPSANIALTTDDHGNTDQMYEFKIGVPHAHTILCKNGDPTPIATSDLDFNVEAFVPFVIHWSKGFLSAAREGQEKPFISFTDTEVLPITHIGVSTTYPSMSDWIIQPAN